MLRYNIELQGQLNGFETILNRNSISSKKKTNHLKSILALMVFDKWPNVFHAL